MAKITFVLEDGQVVVVPLEDHLTIGRDEDNDIVVDDERLSPRHAELVQNADGSLQVFDLNSAAGTFVNGERQISCTLLHGDALAFGPLTGTLNLEDIDAAPLAEKSAPTSAHEAALKSSVLADTSDAVTRLLADKARLLLEVDAAEKELRDCQQRSEKERAMHSARLETFRAEEERLAPMHDAVYQAESAHHDWLEAIAGLSAQYDEKTIALERLNALHLERSTEVRQLTTDTAAAQEGITTLRAQQEQELARLQQIRDECTQDEAQLASLRQQVIEMEAQLKESQTQSASYQEQVQAAELALVILTQRRTEIQAEVDELTGPQGPLIQSLAHTREADAQHGTLTAAITVLTEQQKSTQIAVQELESRLVTLQDTQQKVKAAEETLRRLQADIDTLAAQKQSAQATIQEVEAHLINLQDTQKEAAATQQSLLRLETELTARRADLATETKLLAATKTAHAEIEAHYQHLSATAAQHGELQAAREQAEKKLAALESSLQKLSAKEEATRTRTESLSLREKELRAALETITTSENNARARLDDIRQLTLTEQKERSTVQDRASREVEATRSELATIEAKLQPLRDWKESMDQQYARLATRPQDSPAARDLWSEIEQQKASLLELVDAPGPRPPRIVHVEFAHRSIPMKSERSRGLGVGSTSRNGAD